MGFDENLPTRNYKHILAKKLAANQHHLFYLVHQLFASEPANQWTEITRNATVNFKPIWFSGDRVYQLNVKVEMDKTFKKVGLSKFDFKLETGKDCQTLVSLKTESSGRLQTGVFSTPDSVKLSTLAFQASSYNKEISTQLRLVYCSESKAPRVWIRSPLSTKVMPNSTSLNLAPINAGGSNAAFDQAFDSKMMTAINRKSA